MTKRRHQAVEGIRIPVEVLRDAGLDISRIEPLEDSVYFQHAKPYLDLRRLTRGTNLSFWTRVAKARRKATRRPGGHSVVDATPGLRRFSKWAHSQEDIPPKFLEDARNYAYSEAEREIDDRARLAFSWMSRIAFLRFDGSTFLLSTFNADKPEILAQVKDDEASPGTIEAATEILFWVDIIWQAFIGLLGLMGAKIKNNINAGKWIEKLADIIKRSERLRKMIELFAKVGPTAFGAWDLLNLLIVIFNEGVGWDCLVDLFSDIIDLGYWAILWLLGKISSRFVPGAGQALLIADLGILIIKIAAKFVKRSK